MGNILSYKGYHAKVEYDAESKVLFGKIEGISDLVNFEAENAADIEREFQEAVEDYLSFCEEVGKKPDKEYTGTFNIRISSDLHKKIAEKALKEGESLNKSVEKAISNYVNPIKDDVKGEVQEAIREWQQNVSKSASIYKPDPIASSWFIGTQNTSQQHAHEN